MKYLILGVLILCPLFAKASLAGFLDGNMYDSNTGTWQCLFLGDGNCYDLNENILATRPTSTPPVTIIPPSTPQTVYVPVYITPTPFLISGEPTPPITSTPSPTPTLLPPYSEQDLAVKLGVWKNQDVSGLVKKFYLNFSCFADSSTTASCAGSGVGTDHISFGFNNQFYSSNNNPMAVLTGLTPDTTYSYQIIYTESGRQDSVFTKSFITPSN